MAGFNRLIERMRAMNITQKKLADALGISQPAISRKLNGVNCMWVSEAKRIAEVLAIPSAELNDYFFEGFREVK